jgi:hypothetical protein
MCSGVRGVFDDEVATHDVRECPAGIGLFVVSGELNRHDRG